MKCSRWNHGKCDAKHVYDSHFLVNVCFGYKSRIVLLSFNPSTIILVNQWSESLRKPRDTIGARLMIIGIEIITNRNTLKWIFSFSLIRTSLRGRNGVRLVAISFADLMTRQYACYAACHVNLPSCFVIGRVLPTFISLNWLLCLPIDNVPCMSVQTGKIRILHIRLWR